ncbi:hypothetical protein JKP88DRAFT_241804 [Tribonema minus]|uniref:Uncharacterized protein n=1 Tax=Tribonema minus TaxID=303371 RepID=A0A835YUL4_9STRA|nr:hypothetical protein JKP88DRAFT_241804 [Tribonema minus]
MYSCYDSCFIYGWREPDSSRIIDRAWLTNAYHGKIAIYAEDIVRNYVGNAIYGTSVPYDVTAAGLIAYGDDAKAEIDAIFAEVMKLPGATHEPADYNLGFHIGISGDFQCCDECTYVPGEE